MRKFLLGSPMGRLALALVVDFWWVSPAGSPDLPSGPDDVGRIVSQEALSAAMSAQEQATEDLLRIPGVVGTAVGLGPTGQPVVKVYLERPGIAGIPMAFAGYPIQQEVTGRIVAIGDMPIPEAIDGPIDRKGHFPRPIPIGVSTGRLGVTAGTIGARVTDGTETYALSNNHVFANRNDANVGDNVIQPGVADGGRDPDHAFGKLEDFEEIRFCRGFVCADNKLDAAIASTTPEDLSPSTPSDGYGSPRSETARAALNLAVQKYGRTTGHTKGTVTGLNAIMNVDYRIGTARFVDQIIVSGNGFSTGGDSGSLIVTQGRGNDDRRPVGLLFAGSATTTIANPIDLVLDRFGVSVDGG